MAASTRLFILSVMAAEAPSLGRRDLVADERLEPGPDRVRRDQQSLVLHVAPVAGQVVEELGEVGTDRRIAREQTHVLVDAGGLAVVVAGADVAVAAHAVGLVAHDQGGLGVDLQADQAVDDVHARCLQAPWPTRCWPPRRSGP